MQAPHPGQALPHHQACMLFVLWCLLLCVVLCCLCPHSKLSCLTVELAASALATKRAAFGPTFPVSQPHHLCLAFWLCVCWRWCQCGVVLTPQNNLCGCGACFKCSSHCALPCCHCPVCLLPLWSSFVCGCVCVSCSTRCCCFATNKQCALQLWWSVLVVLTPGTRCTRGSCLFGCGGRHKKVGVQDTMALFHGPTSKHTSQAKWHKKRQQGQEEQHQQQGGRRGGCWKESTARQGAGGGVVMGGWTVVQHTTMHKPCGCVDCAVKTARVTPRHTTRTPA